MEQDKNLQDLEAMEESNNMEVFDEMDEPDTVVFEDDKGNQITMEVIDYLFYEGKEYALLAEMDTAGEERDKEAYVMEVVALEEDPDMEEFVPVDEDLAEKLIEIFQNIDLEDEEFEEE